MSHNKFQAWINFNEKFDCDILTRRIDRHGVGLIKFMPRDSPQFELVRLFLSSFLVDIM